MCTNLLYDKLQTEYIVPAYTTCWMLANTIIICTSNNYERATF